jgi:hypothetical protein
MRSSYNSTRAARAPARGARKTEARNTIIKYIFAGWRRGGFNVARHCYRP